jgi:hypothetical protein
MNAEEPLDAQPTAFPPAPAGLPLNGQQRALLEVLGEMDQRLGEMYLGALAVLQQPFNGERVSQASHTLRIMIDRLPVSLELKVEALDDRMGDRLQQPERAWQTALKNSSCFDGENWSGSIDSPLARALTVIQEFFVWKKESRPRRREELTQILRRLDTSGKRLPATLERLAVEELTVIRGYFIDICHHRINVDEAEFFAYLDAFERFVIDRQHPRTFADFDVIDAIIEEADRGD